MSKQPAAPPTASRSRLITAEVLVVLASICAVIALFAGYVKFQAFDKQTFKTTAAELIADPTIRDQVAITLVDELYSNVDVAKALQQQLPPGAKALAAPIAGALRELANRAAVTLLERPRVQTAWVSAASATQQQLVQLLDNRGKVIRTQGGNVVLNLRPLVIQLGDRIAIIKRVQSRLPGKGIQITIMKADQLQTAQRVTKFLKAVGGFAWLVPLILIAVAVWLARGKRRVMLRHAAIGAIIAGLLVLAIRRVGGSYVVNHLVTTASLKPAVSHAWTIVTKLLADGAWTLIFVAAVTLVGVWIAGETQYGRSVRRRLAGPLARPEIAFGFVLAVVVILVWWGPTPQARRWYIVLAGTVIFAIGVEALRRQTARETRDALGAPPPLPAAEG
jgi:hypothetical protein